VDEYIHAMSAKLPKMSESPLPTSFAYIADLVFLVIHVSIDVPAKPFYDAVGNSLSIR
jgi:hypothetical protein